MAGAPNSPSAKETTENAAIRDTPYFNSLWQFFRSPAPKWKLTSGCMPWAVPVMVMRTRVLT